MPFEFDGKAEIKNINIRKGASDDSHVSLDIKIHIEGVPATSAAAALGAENPADIETALFRSVSEDAERTAKFLGLKGLVSNAKWEGKHAVTFKGHRRLRVHNVGKITLHPRHAGKFDLTCSIVIQDPPAGYLDNIKEFINHEIGVKLEHDAELALEGGGKTAPTKASSQSSLKLSRHDAKLGRKDANNALKGSRRPRSGKKPKVA